MSEPGPEFAESSDPVEHVARPEGTGVESVDEVVRAIDEASSEPLADQVAVLEQAHAALRRALD